MSNEKATTASALIGGDYVSELHKERLHHLRLQALDIAAKCGSPKDAETLISDANKIYEWLNE